MNDRNRKTVLRTIVLMLTILAGLVTPAPALRAQSSANALAIEITLPSGNIVYAPASEGGETLVVIPLQDKLIQGVRFSPRKTRTGILIEVAGLLRGKGKSELDSSDYDGVRNWPSKAVGTFEGKEGTSFDLSELGKLNLTKLPVTITAARPSPLADSKVPIFVAGKMKGSPPKGSCMQLGPLALCCWGNVAHDR